MTAESPLATPEREPTPGGEETAPTRLERAGDIAARIGSLQPADPNVRRGLHAAIWIAVALSVGLAVFASAGDLPEIDWRFRPAALALALFGFTAFLVANGELWQRILGALGPTLAKPRARAIYFTSALGRFVPTSLLLPMLRAAMAEKEGVPKRISLASVIYEIALFLTAGLVLSAYFVIDLPELNEDPGRFLVLALPVLAIVALQPRIFHTLSHRALKRLGRPGLPRSLPSSTVWKFVGLYGLNYAVAGLSMYALAQCVYPVAGSDLVTVATAYAVGTALSILAFVVPGGLVAREAGIALALSPVMPAGPAVAVAVLARIVQVTLEVLLAVIAPLRARSKEQAGG